MTDPFRPGPARPTRRALLLAAAGMTAAALAGCGGETPSTQTGNVRRYAEADRRGAPKVAGELLAGGAFDMSSLAGKVVVVNFWASWCAPCRLEAPALEKVYTQTRATGVEFVGINTGDERDPAKLFATARNSYPSIFDPSGKLVLGFSDIPPSAIPSTVIIDRRGRIAALTPTAIREDALRALVDEVAAEKAG